MPIISPTQPNRPKRTLKHKLWRHIIAPLLVLFLGIHLLIAILLGIGRVVPVNYSMFMLAHHLQGGKVNQVWADSDAITKATKQAVIVSEDANFVNHYGFDINGITHAIKTNNKTGTIKFGGSTITQQLAKNLFLSSHRSYIRKGEEAIITLMIETIWDKERILTVYLNVAEFGTGIYGIEAAAQHYFNKSADQLSKDQAALLISLLPRPKYYEDRLNDPRLQRKKRIILKRLPSAVLPKQTPSPSKN